MANRGPVVEGAEVQLVADSAYFPVLQTLVRSARERLWCTLFIIELMPAADPQLNVPGVLRALAAALWRGVDVRLLIGGSRTNLDIAETAGTAMRVARQLRLPTRWIQSAAVRGSHVKLVIADSYVLTGSHNWSPGAFGSQTQDSLVVHSPDLAAYLGSVFATQWKRTSGRKDTGA